MQFKGSDSASSADKDPEKSAHSGVEPSALGSSADAAARRMASVPSSSHASPDTIQIFVRGLDNRTNTLDVPQMLSGEELFAAVSKRLGLPIDKIRIICAGKEIRIDDGVVKLEKEVTLHTLL